MICPVAHLHWVVVFPSFWGSWVELLKMFTNYCTFDPLFFIIWEHCQHQLLRTVTAPEKASDNTDGGSLNANVCFGTKSCWWPIQHCILWIGQWWPCEKHEWYLVVTSQTKNSSSDSNLITVHVSRCFLFQSLLLSGGAETKETKIRDNSFIHIRRKLWLIHKLLLLCLRSQDSCRPNIFHWQQRFPINSYGACIFGEKQNHVEHMMNHTVSQHGWSCARGCLVLWGVNPCCSSCLWWERKVQVFLSAKKKNNTQKRQS